VLERAHYFLPDAGLRLIQTYLTRCEEAECEPDADLTQRMYAAARLRRASVSERASYRRAVVRRVAVIV
jgi:hypothetical protein